MTRVHTTGRERPSTERILQEEQGPQDALIQDRYQQQRAALEAGEVGIACESIVTRRILHKQRLPSSLGIAEGPERQQQPRVPASSTEIEQPGSPTVEGTSQRCVSSSRWARSTLVAPVIAPSNSQTRALIRSRLVSELKA